jgi:hypothetical protein
VRYIWFAHGHYFDIALLSDAPDLDTPASSTCIVCLLYTLAHSLENASLCDAPDVDILTSTFLSLSLCLSLRIFFVVYISHFLCDYRVGV